MATQEQYYAGFEGRIQAWDNTSVFMTGDIVQIGTSYYQAIQDHFGEDPRTSTGFWESYTFQALGDSRFVTLEDIVTNYMVLYADESNHGGMPKRTKVEAFAQRAVQEYSYDTFKVKTWEYQVIDRATFPMPQDFVELVGINYVDDQGRERWLTSRKESSNPRSPLQFDNTPEWDGFATYAEGDYVKYVDPDIQRPQGRDYTVYRTTEAIEGIDDPTPTDEPNTPPPMDSIWEEVQAGLTGFVYDSDGNIILFENTSVTQQRWDENDYRRNPEILTGTQGGYANFTGYAEHGRRYYASTEFLNSNPTYYINERDGVIDLDTILIGEVINLTYVSDGLSSNLEEIKVHKFAEQAMYEAIYYEMICHMSRVPANEKQRAQRRMVAKHRQAKLRLMGLSPRDLIQTLRAQAKWIKT